MINNISYLTGIIQSPNLHQRKNISFGQNIQTLTHTNIGSCLEGYIGKIRVRKPDGETYLNVFKKYIGRDAENYVIQNDKNEAVGSINVFIRKSQPNPWDKTDPSHVFVDELRNFSKPNTPYHNPKLEYFKDIGTRLLQIDEANCCGNIKLISKGESLNWYKNVIGMRQEFPPIPGMKFQIHNPNQLYLPPEAKEPLSRLQGGL